jgi:opacity protein-like surface antigen
MHRTFYLLAGFLVVAFTGSDVRAENSWYILGSLGAYLREDASGATSFSNGIVSGQGTNRFSFDPGPIANVAIGHKLPANFRAEIEAGYASYFRSKVNPQSASIPALDGSDFNRVSGGRFNNYSGTLNLFYDIPINDALAPYVGIGMGGVHRDLSRATYVSSGGTRFLVAGGSGNFGTALVEAGLSVDIGQNLSIVPAYRYSHFFSDTPQSGDEVAHIAKLGLRYSF